MLRDEICARLSYLCEVGVGYLTLERSTRTLSGGEVQRVNLTTCLGASLANTLFVMDEPSIGLHPRDVGQLVRVMHNLRDKGNTLLVVEHEEQIIRAADNLIDLGPGRGEHGGDLVWNGPLDDLLNGAGAPSRRIVPGKRRGGAPTPFKNSSNGPFQTNSPPCSPRPGPKSIKLSAARMICSSCSTTSKVLPLSRRLCITRTN